MHHKSFRTCRLAAFLFAMAALGPLGSGACGAEADDVRAALARAPRPWSARMYHFSREEYEETLRYWAESTRGSSPSRPGD